MSAAGCRLMLPPSLGLGAPTPLRATSSNAIPRPRGGIRWSSKWFSTTRFVSLIASLWQLRAIVAAFHRRSIEITIAHEPAVAVCAGLVLNSSWY